MNSPSPNQAGAANALEPGRFHLHFHPSSRLQSVADLCSLGILKRRLALSIAALTALYAIFALVRFTPYADVPIHPGRGGLREFYYPMTVIATVILGAGLWQMFEPDTRASAVLLCLLSLPMPIVAAHQLTWHAQIRHSALWPDLALVLGDALLTYHEQHPAAFRYVGSDEEVRVEGFADYLRQLGSAAIPRGWQIQIKTKDDSVLDPWGEAIRFGLDRDHDGYVEMQGVRVLTSGVNPPNLDYVVAVASSLSHKDNGDYRGLAKRR